MKKIFKSKVFKAIIAIVVIYLVCGVIGYAVGCHLGNKEVVVEDNAVFTLRLAGTLSERSAENPFGALLGEETDQLSLSAILSSIKKAKENDKIEGIYINVKSWVCDSPASAEAIRAALADFKESGKWVIAYGDTYSQTSYYIASVADKVYLNPQGIIDWHGLASQPYFLKNLLAKVGIKMQTVKVGKYKSYVETYTADKMSDANREQVSVYLNNIWSVMLRDVSDSRGVAVDELNAIADGITAFESPESYVERGLVDTLVYRTAMNAEIMSLLEVEDEDDIQWLSVGDMVNVKDVKKAEGGEVAVYYAFGSIVESATGGIAADPCIASSDVIWDLKDLAEDDDVKAVVLRVNSGGGSAYASEQIWHAIVELKAKKPVVVSMGGYAASGGYYISSPANYIFAEETTITGSIGIFGMIPDMSELVTKKLDVKFDEVKTNKNSGFGDISRPMNAAELAAIGDYIDRGYALFRSRVSQGRGISTDSVETIAQGRVWTGSDAIDIRLVDEIGGLDAAIAKAAELAELGEYHTKGYPEEKDFLTELMDSMLGMDKVSLEVKDLLGDYYEPFMFIKDLNYQNAVQARMTERINF